MSCSVCSAHSRLFHCPTCARNQLYQLRIDNTQVLLEKEDLQKQVEAVQSPLRTIENDHAESLTRKELLERQLQVLRPEVEARKAEINRRKEVLARRRSDAESANHQLAERETGMLASAQNTSKRVEHVWHSLHSKTAESRIYLCREVANLYGLQKIKSQGRETYMLGCGFIVDLRDINAISPQQISTSLSNIAHLLIIVSHYLSLRLPAEITLPHKNYPAPTIYTLPASYSKNQSSHPRPLSIDKPLPRLAKEDPATYAFFLEGATLLAWNVAWLCRTQGLNISSDSWEEVCDIGKSLWQLLVGPPSMLRVKRESLNRSPSFPLLGHYSHGTAHSFLGASEGVEFMRIWKLPTPTKIVDNLKSNLLGEMASAEWELLEEKEWTGHESESNKKGWTKVRR